MSNTLLAAGLVALLVAVPLALYAPGSPVADALLPSAARGAEGAHARLGGHAGLAENAPSSGTRVPAQIPPAKVALAGSAMTFRALTVDATATYNDLYEPAVTIAPTGVIYVSGHTTIADTLRSVAFFSKDAGKTWSKLPDVANVALPVSEGVGQGDEGILAADGQGNAWLYDSNWIAGPSFLYQWCDNGATLCKVDPLAYDLQQSLVGPCGARTIDKPWVQYGHGKLVMTNNGPGTGLNPDTQLQVGLYDVATGQKTWNTCAGKGGRPGMPAIRDSDGMIAAPQAQGPESAPYMAITTGTDVAQLTAVKAFDTFGDWVNCNAFNGFGAFDHAGTYFVAGASKQGTMTVAASADLRTFVNTSFDVAGQVYFAWMTGSMTGPGALLSWAVSPMNDCLHPTFYAAHVQLVNGAVQVSDVSLVHKVDAGWVCGHYMGNAVDPQGRAVLVIFESPGGCLGPQPEVVPLTHRPLKLYVQDSGPTI